MIVRQEERNGQVVPVSMEIENEKEVEFLLDQLRPKGEWKTTDAYPHKVYCNKCFKTYAQKEWRVWEDKTLPRNFCPNCGADMRTKGDTE